MCSHFKYLHCGNFEVTYYGNEYMSSKKYSSRKKECRFLYFFRFPKERMQHNVIMTTSNNRGNMAASGYYSSYICTKYAQAYLKYTFTIIGVIDSHP